MTDPLPFLLLLAAVSCAPSGDTSSKAPAAESIAAPAPPSAAPISHEERLRTLQRRLRDRLELDLASDLGPRMADRLNRLGLAQAERGGDFLRVKRGWITVKVAETFLALNPEWADPSLESVVEPGGEQAATVIDFHRQLAERGVELIVIPIPTRLNVEPDVLEGISFEESRAGFSPGLTRWMLELAEQGVVVFDLMPALAEARASGRYEPGQVFLEVNHHWGPDGARIAAEALAGELRTRPWFPPGVVQTTSLEAVRLTPPLPDRPAGEAAPELRFERVLGPDGEPPGSRDPDSPVVVLGDSFTTFFENQSADFTRHLHHSMGFAPDVIAMPGGSVKSAWSAFARRQDPLEGKRVVVWMLGAPAIKKSGWTRIPLYRSPGKRGGRDR